MIFRSVKDKKYLPGFIAVIFIIFIFLSFSSQPDQLVIRRDKNNSEKSIGPKKSTANLFLPKFFSKDEAIKTSNKTADLLDENNVQSDNLTKTISQLLSKQLTSLSPIEVQNIYGREEEFIKEFLLDNNSSSGFLALNKSIKTLELSVIKDSEIIINKSNSRDDLKEYIINVAKIFVEEPKIRQSKSGKIYSLYDEEEIINKAIIEQDLGPLEDLIAYYQYLIDKLIALPTPQKAVNLHKKRIAIFKLSLNILKTVKEFRQDPFLTLEALKKYKDLNPYILEMVNETKQLTKFLD